MKITPSGYNQYEFEASINCSVPMLQAFLPVTYMQFGYPVRIDDERELIRYVDHNFESQVPDLFKSNATFPYACYVNSFTDDEFKIINSIREEVALLCQNLFGRRIMPITTPLVQVAPFRIFSAISEEFNISSLNIFEAGPGLGYLGAMLIKAEHKYISFDVTQSMYIWQNYLFNAISNNIIELASAANVPSLIDSQVIHLPWWHYVNLEISNIQAPVDIFYSNSNLCEMSLFSLRVLLEKSKNLMKGSRIGLFFYMGTGYPGQISVDLLNEEFLAAGYRKIEGLPFNAYSLNPIDLEKKLKEIFSNGVPFYNPSKKVSRIEAKMLVALKKSEAPLDVADTSWFYGWNPPFID